LINISPKVSQQNRVDTAYILTGVILMIHSDHIKSKFGGNYIADEQTYKMGIDVRFSEHLAIRFNNLTVLETCTGGGFSTLSLARYARHVYTVEIDKSRVQDAKKNAKLAGIEQKITFINGDVLAIDLIKAIPTIDAAFLDPDWADTGANHVYKFIKSNTNPPSDILLKAILSITPNVTLIQPSFINPEEFEQLPAHECELLYLGGSHELYCLHFGKMAKLIGTSEYQI
jgi:hypothetical protein